jgi:nicotinamidase-related amidase
MKQALISLDVQRIYTNRKSELYCSEAGKTIGKINRLINEMLKMKQMIVLVRHMHKIDGSDLGRLFDYTGEAEEDFNFKEGTEDVEFDPRLIRPVNSIEIIKNRYSAFAGTNLERVLKENGIKRLVISGFMTNFCCESTARDALDRDFYVDFVIDATGTPGTDNFDQVKVRKVVGELLSAGFARVISTAEIISLWKKV